MKISFIKQLGFKISLAVFLATILATYAVYWHSIKTLHDQTMQLSNAFDHLAMGERLHSALHSMLMNASSFESSGGKAIYRESYEIHLKSVNQAITMLRSYSDNIPECDAKKVVSKFNNGLQDGIADYRALLDPVFTNDLVKLPATKHLSQAEELFDSLFQNYYVHLYEHNTIMQNQVRANSREIWNGTTTFFIVQLILALMAGSLAILYLDKVVLKVWVFTERMALRDRLTGLYNRLALERIIEGSVSANEDEGKYGLVILDLDHFKKFNDTHGHQAGDKLLEDLARLLEDRVRSQDKVVRYGGEEFLVVLNEADLTIAAMVAEKIRKAIEDRRFLLPDGQPAPQVTASLGIASSPVDGHDFDAVLKVADTRLYQAKNTGRNRVGGIE